MTLTLSSVTGSTYQYWPSDPCQLCSLIRVSAITLFFKAFWSIIKSKVVMTCSQNTPLPSLKDGLMVSIRKTFISINAFFHFFCLVESFRVDFQFTMNTQPRVYELRPHKKVITTSWGFIYYPAVLQQSISSISLYPKLWSMSINNISINQNSKEEKEIKKKKVCLCYRHAYLFVFCGSVRLLNQYNCTDQLSRYWCLLVDKH